MSKNIENETMLTFLVILITNNTQCMPIRISKIVPSNIIIVYNYSYSLSLAVEL